MKSRLLIIVGVIVIISIGISVTVAFFTYRDLYDIISSYDRINDVNDSIILKNMRNIPEVNEFLVKHVNTTRIIAIETDPIFITLHASGGYTGEYLKMYYFFDEPLHITYGCWTDNGNASDMLFTSDIINHIKEDSCMDHFNPTALPKPLKGVELLV